MEIMLHPEWSYQAVIYEMNVRQLTREGTLRAAAAKLGEKGVEKLLITIGSAGAALVEDG